jgi:ubiquinone/menaquinone biosynthesis C-methylase UbiE
MTTSASTGSSYEKYEKTHSNYDKTRMAVGSEQIIRFLRAQFPDDSRQPRILDAGCGTGVHLLGPEASWFRFAHRRRCLKNWPGQNPREARH